MDPDLDLSLEGYGDTSDGDGSLTDGNTLEASSLAPDQSLNDLVPTVDNINGSSNVANPSPSIFGQLNSGSLGTVLDSLTGGASGLADGLTGLIDPTPANSTEDTNPALSTPVVVGGIVGLGVLIFLLTK